MSVSFSHSQLDPLMGILKEHIGHMQKDQLTSHQSELTYFLISLSHELMTVGTKDIMERDLIDCLLAFVIKLFEVSFRPLFFKVFDWVMTESAAKDHLLTLYRLLGGLFTDGLCTAASIDEYILDCLHKICLYDTKHFVSTESANALMTPLVDQLNTLGGEEVYHTRVTKHLVLCVGHFCLLHLLYSVHVTTFDLISSLHTTRCMCVFCVTDKCEKVEHQVQKIIHEMENILGEPLLSYLSSASHSPPLDHQTRAQIGP
uniref:HEAT repeat-containing protein 1 n=1 Tax=Oncorhynchus tshawytscha TaxID=74940 RepID=A0AAZ3QHQ8_ONCTS